MDRSPEAEGACQVAGGVPYLIGNMVGQPLSCVAPAVDAGKACDRSSDCSVACDAKSHQCRAADPLGAVLDAKGREVWALN